MSIIGRSGFKLDCRTIRVASIRSECIRSTLHVGIESFSVRRFIQQNDVPTSFLHQCFNPCVTRIASKRLFEILRYSPKLYVHGQHRWFRCLGSSDALGAEENTAQESK